MENNNHKVKTLLLNLPEIMNEAPDTLMQPYGLAMISSVLKQRNHNVTLFDASAYQLNKDEILQYIMNEKPRILGTTCMTNDLGQTIGFLSDVKKCIPDLITVLGGPHPTIEYKSLLHNHPEVDVACIGEGEYTMLEIVENVQNETTLDNIKGIAFRSNEKIKVNPPREYIRDLDSLPFADWDSLPMDKYFFQWTVKKNYATLSLSRGCSFACSFCVQNYIGRTIRRRSPENIIEELNLLYDKYHVRNCEFNDSTMNSDNAWLREICEGIISLNKPILWGCQFRADKADKETLKLMKRSGCNRIYIGVESGDNRMLKNMKKGQTIEQIEKAIHMVLETGIKPDLGFVIGMPGETEESIMKTIKFAKQYINCSVSFTLATPYPGSDMYEKIQKEGYRVDDWSKHSMHKLVYVPNDLTKENLQFLYNLAIKKIYLNPFFIINQILRIQSWINFKITLRFAYRLFFKRLGWFKR